MAKKVAKVSAKRVSNRQIKSKTPPSNPQIKSKSGSNPQIKSKTPVSNPQPSARQAVNPVLSANTGPVGGMITSVDPISNPQITANTGGVVPQISANSGMANNINNQRALANSGRPQPVQQNVQQYEGAPIDVEGQVPAQGKKPARKRAQVSATRSKVPTRKPKANPATQEASTPNFNFFFAGKMPY